ncbi:MAG: YceI family protein [Granulosicoccus sp.]
MIGKTNGKLVAGILLVLHASLLLAGCAAIVTPNYTQTVEALRAGQYELDTDHAYIHFGIEHLGLSTIVGRFNNAEATLDFDPEAVTALRLDGRVDVASIDLNSAALEKRLRGQDWLNTERYPQATFTSVRVIPVDSNIFNVEGDFTLRGVTRKLTLETHFKGGADNLLTGKYTLGFSASGSFLRSDYGIDGFRGLIADEVSVEINAEFQRTGE